MQHRLHARHIPGRIIVSSKRHHPQTQPNPHIKRQTLHLEHNPNRSQRNITVRRHQPIEHNIIEIKQKRPQSSRNPHSKKRRQMRSTRSPIPQRKMQDRTMQPQNSDHKISARNSIRKRRSNPRAQNLAPGRQQHKHKQRIQNNIDDPTHRNRKSGLLRQPHISQQIPHSHRRDRRRPAKHYDASAVLPGKLKRLLTRPQQRQQRRHKHRSHNGKK